MIRAIKNHCGAVNEIDVFANPRRVTVGLDSQRLAMLLVILLSALSSFRNKALDHDLAVFGEVGLAGELRPVQGGLLDSL